MLRIRVGDRILFRDEYGGTKEAFVLHKFWLFGTWLRIVTFKSQDYRIINSKRVNNILERNAIGKYV